HRLQEVVLSGNVADLKPFFLLLKNKRKHAVIRREKEMAIGPHKQRTTGRPNSRINNDKVNRVRRKILVRLRNSDRSVEQVVSLNRVRDVHKLDVGIDVENDALHRADIMIGDAEVSGEGNNAGLRHNFLDQWNECLRLSMLSCGLSIDECNA